MLHYQFTFSDPTRQPRPDVPAHIYYPSEVPTGGVPLIVFAHCYLGAGKWYRYVADALIPAGYVMVSLDTWDYDPVSSPGIESKDQQFLVGAARDQATNNQSSPLYGLLNSKTGAMGHSMGGGATVITAGQVGLVDAQMTLSGAYDKAVEDAGNKVIIPSLIMTGSDDCICPPDTNAIPIWNSLISTPCKYYVNIMNATHCHFDEVDHTIDTACEVIETPCLDGHQIPRETQWAFVQKYVVPWFNFALKGDSSAQSTLNNYLQTDVAEGLVFDGRDNCTNPTHLTQF